jgi:hypothetical protein
MSVGKPHQGRAIKLATGRRPDRIVRWSKGTMGGLSNGKD